jgi:hypothetical protein
LIVLHPLQSPLSRRTRLKARRKALCPCR